ncbi:ribonuclease H-like domain-containing protein [Tanacetum coccineum]
MTRSSFAYAFPLQRLLSSLAKPDALLHRLHRLIYSDSHNLIRPNNLYNSNDKSGKPNESGPSDFNPVFDDPLFLHPNDTSGNPIISFKLTGTENYNMWSCVMKFALRNKNKLGFIDGTCKRDSNSLAMANQWDMCNFVVATWILGSLSPELYVRQIYSKTALDM